MVEILSLEPRAMHSAGEYWRYTKLCEPFDVLADKFMVPLTDGRDASGITVRRCSKKGPRKTILA
jgi:hypothetical protein